MSEGPGADYLDLYDFRLRVAALYRARNAALAAGEDPAGVVSVFRQGRDRLFAHHTQSALDADQKGRFVRLEYFPYLQHAVVEATVEAPVTRGRIEVQLGDAENVTLAPAARLRFSFAGQSLALTMYWIDVYGGGLFLPFRDRTAPNQTYGGGRYLFDTVKGSDFQRLPADGGRQRLTLDFNYAYNPSCAYNPHWVCPLAPSENDLAVEITAGEKRFRDFPVPA